MEETVGMSILQEVFEKIYKFSWGKWMKAEVEKEQIICQMNLQGK